MAKKNVNPKIQHKGVKSVKQAARAHSSARTPRQAPAAAPGWLEVLSAKPWLPWALMAFLLVFVSLLYFPVAFGGKTPHASDISQWQ